MSLLDLDLENVPDLVLLPIGEYRLRIESAKEKTSKNGKEMLEVMFIPVDEADAAPIFEYIMLPDSSDEERTANAKKRRLRDLVKAFNIPNYGELNNWTGCTGFAAVVIETDPQYGDKNRIKAYSVPASGGTAASNFNPAPGSAAIPF